MKKSIKRLLEKTPKERFRNNGFLGIDRVWSTDFEIAKANQESYEVVLDSKSIELFESFLQECKAMNIELALVYTPEYIKTLAGAL